MVKIAPFTPKVYEVPPFHYTTYRHWIDENDNYRQEPMVVCSDPKRCELHANISPRSDKA